MELYLKLIDVIVPIFALIGIGYYLGKNNPKIDTTFITKFAANIGTTRSIVSSKMVRLLSGLSMARLSPRHRFPERRPYSRKPSPISRGHRL